MNITLQQGDCLKFIRGIPEARIQNAKNKSDVRLF